MANDSTTYSEKYLGNTSQQSGLMEVCSALKLNILRTLRVASYGRVEKVNDETIYVKLFPRLENEGSSSDDRIIQCPTIYVEDYTLEEKQVGLTTKYELKKKWVSLATKIEAGDIVLVVCLDRVSNTALNQAKLKTTITKLNENTNLHTEECAVVVGIVDKLNKEEE